MNNLPWVFLHDNSGIHPPLHIAVEYRLLTSIDTVRRGTTGTLAYGVFDNGPTQYRAPVFVEDVPSGSFVTLPAYVHSWRCVNENDARACGLL